MGKTWIKAVIFVLTVSLVKSQLPSSIRTCPRNHPNLSQCVRQMIEYLRPNIKSGDYGSGFRTESIEPLRIDDIILRKPGLSGKDTNVIAHGLGNFVVDKLNYEIGRDKFLFDVLLSFAHINVIGDYVNIFKFGFINAQSEGKFKAVLRNMKFRLTTKGRLVNKNGQTYVKIETVNILPKITQIQVLLENVIPNNPTLSEAVNAFLNQNVDLFVPDVEVAIKSTLHRLYKSSVQRNFDIYPLSVIHP